MKKLHLYLIAILIVASVAAQKKNFSIKALKKEVRENVLAKSKMAQVMVDKVFSFSELGFQEIETSKYLTEMLKNNGFEIEYGISGVPTAWWAKWGSG